MSDFLFRFSNTAWFLFKNLWYWVIIGTFLAQIATKLIPFQKMQHSAQGGIRAVGITTIAGAGLPLCACGVIPFLVSFLRVGAPLAVIMAFTAAKGKCTHANGWGDQYCSKFAAAPAYEDTDKALRIYRMGLEHGTTEDEAIEERIAILKESLA